jgi:hypothetical protein
VAFACSIFLLACVFVHVCVHVCTRARMCACACVCMRACTRARMCVCACVQGWCHVLLLVRSSQLANFPQLQQNRDFSLPRVSPFLTSWPLPAIILLACEHHTSPSAKPNPPLHHVPVQAFEMRRDNPFNFRCMRLLSSTDQLMHLPAGPKVCVCVLPYFLTLLANYMLLLSAWDTRGYFLSH